MKKNKPWLNADGTEKSTEELRRLGENWDLKTWKAYAKTLEVKRSESLLEEPTDIEKQSDSDQRGQWGSDEWKSYFNSLDVPLEKKPGGKANEFEGLSDEEIMEYLWIYSDYELHPTMALAIRLMLRMLPKRQREIIYLVYKDEKSLADIARLLKESRSAITQKRKSALKNVKALILNGSLDKFINLYKDKGRLNKT